MKKMMLWTMVILVVGSVSTGFGGMPWRCVDGTEFPRLKRLAAFLDLTAAQRSEIRSLVQKEKAEIRRLADLLRQNRAALGETGLPGEFDDAVVRAYAEEQSGHVADLIVIRQRIRSGVGAVLTPEQREKAADLRAFWLTNG